MSAPINNSTPTRSPGEFPSRKDQFKPGQSGNPLGRPVAGASVREWFNAMADYTREQLEAVMADPKASAAKVSAARTWLGAMSHEKNAAGVPVAGADLGRICDRTEGRPKQAVQVDGGLATPATRVEVIVPGLSLKPA